MTRPIRVSGLEDSLYALSQAVVALIPAPDRGGARA
jgi:hypothetical protein